MARDLLKFRINEMSPFMTHRDCANDRLREAHALSLLIGDVNLAGDEVFTSMNPDLRHSICEAVTNLIAYAQFHLDAANEESRAQKLAVAS